MIALLITLLASWAPCVPDGADFKIAKLAHGCPSPIDGILLSQDQYREFLEAEQKAQLLDKTLDALRVCESDRIDVTKDCRRDIAILDCPEPVACSNTAAWSVGACALCAGAAIGISIGVQ